MILNTAQVRSDTTPTRTSTISSASITSKRILVYDMAENTTKKLSHDEFDSLYPGLQPEHFSRIPLPKNAAYIDVSSDELRTHITEDDRCTSPEQMTDSFMDSSTNTSRSSRSSSTQVSVKIPWSVFLHRGFRPSSYTDLYIITRPSPNSSTKSSRSNTDGLHINAD